ncbi:MULTISPECIES: MFS transporter [Thalassobaculum]|uniref:Predicted arabinose efflux permease, MFS family n=1 Tax=Thalassobaculum litoreum DSM 18839 TaxID=1123362 RepID=A0A8G2BLR6_9PROT|nr:MULTISPECIES: MFS transporter [Thalassobaculum]SDG43763.1 Predicted arabinose efflux permease, MFS family [Thalassobaculum litoreum DSM 18839]
MTSSASTAAAFPTGRVAALAIAETLVWAGMFYSFPALIAYWEADLGWSKTELAGAYSAALVCSALCAPLMGKIIDKGHGRAVLTVCAVVGGVLVGLLSVVQASWQFFVLWLGIGVCMSGCLYEPCFAFVTRMMGGEARRAITRITLIAGFAGTVSFPLAGFVSEAYGWRVAVLTFAVIILVVAIPLFRYGTALPAPEEEPETRKPLPGSSSDLRRAMAKPTFWLLGITFSMIGLTHGIIITHLLPMLAERDVPVATAVLAASMIGPMQVAGRVAMMVVERRLSMQVICAVSFLFMIAAISSLIGSMALPALLVLFVFFQGSGYGVTSITRPVVTAEILGRQGFGSISGALALGFMGANAAAATLGAAIWEVGGYAMVRWMVFGCVLVGLMAFLTAMTLAKRERAA